MFFPWCLPGGTAQRTFSPVATPGLHHDEAMIYALAAAIIWGVEYSLLVRLLGTGISVSFLFLLQSLVSALMAGAICLAAGTIRPDCLKLTGDQGTLLLAALSTILFAAGNLMIARSIRSGNAVVTSFIEMSYPLIFIALSLALGWITRVEFRTMAGGLVVMAGVAILSMER
jgi:drug/metabolite transporter (DMT)-like permease